MGATSDTVRRASQGLEFFGGLEGWVFVSADGKEVGNDLPQGSAYAIWVTPLDIPDSMSEPEMERVA